MPIHWSDANASCGADRRNGQSRDRSVLRATRIEGDACTIARDDYGFAGFTAEHATNGAAGPYLVGEIRRDGGEGTLLASHEGPDDLAERGSTPMQAMTFRSPNMLDQPPRHLSAAAFVDGRLGVLPVHRPAAQRPQWDAAKALLAAESWKTISVAFCFPGSRPTAGR